MQIEGFDVLPPKAGSKIRHARAPIVNTFIPSSITTDNDVDRNINKIAIEDRMHNIKCVASLDASKCKIQEEFELDGLATIIRDRILYMRHDEELNLNYEFIVKEYGQESARILLLILDSMLRGITGLRIKMKNGIINVGYRF